MLSLEIGAPFAIVGVTRSRRVASAVREVAERGVWIAQVTPEPDRALALVAAGVAALVAVDARLPGADAAFARRLRDAGARLAWLHARRQAVGELLRLGDEVLPPRAPAREVVRRLRRALGGGSGVRRLGFRLGPLAIDLAGRRVLTGARAVSLTPAEHALLLLLVTRRGRVVDKHQIVSVVLDSHGSGQNAYFHVHNLKRKLGPAAPLLETIRGEGYRLSASAGRPLHVAGGSHSSQ